VINRRLGVAALGLLLAAVVVHAAEYDFQLIEPVRSDLGYYRSEDGVSFLLLVLTKSIYCSIDNHSPHTVTIDWNRCSITTQRGTSNIMRDGQRYIDKDAVIPPTTIPPGGSVTHDLTPTSSVFYSSQVRSWLVLDMPREDGSRVGLYLALEVGGRPADQYFVFEAVEKPAVEKLAEESSPATASVPPLLRTIIKVVLVLSIILVVTGALPES